jgi:acetyltransferase-like isoleucine patch superfamily enzyme
MKALREVGYRRLLRYGAWRAYATALRAMPSPPGRSAFLRVGGATVGPDTVIMPGLRLENLDRYRGPTALRIGRDCFISYDVHMDLAAEVDIGNQVSIGPKTTIATHRNVGYADHPLQARFPARAEPVSIGPGSFIAAGTILLPGTTLGPQTFVAAGAVVRGTHPGHELLGGIPAKLIRSWNQEAPRAPETPGWPPRPPGRAEKAERPIG